MCLMPRPGCWIYRSKHLWLKTGRWTQLKIFGERRDLSHGSLVVDICWCKGGLLGEVRLEELTMHRLCSTEEICVLTFLCLIRDLQRRHMCQVVEHLLEQTTVAKYEPWAVVEYVPAVLHWKHKKQQTGIAEDMKGRQMEGWLAC
jgi:hypothetical protein